MSSFRWREALMCLVVGAFSGYVFAQINKSADHPAVLARCKLQEQTPERIELCMRAAGYEFSDTQCEGAEIVSERQRLTNSVEINAARNAALDPFIEDYLRKNPGQSRTMAELMVREAAKRRSTSTNQLRSTRLSLAATKTQKGPARGTPERARRATSGARECPEG
jgi:hypothetical protein